jgi:hypothetical protein
MPPRTPLGIIDGNRRQGGELIPYQRGKIEGARNAGSTFAFAADQVKCAPSTARSTLLLAPERLDGHTRKRTGRPMPGALDSSAGLYVLHDGIQK